MKEAVPVIVVFGPTAVGKTEFLLNFGKIGEIINLDSLQVYRYMSIGTAKPDSAVTDIIPHHLIDCIDPDTEFCAGDFVSEADRLCQEIYSRGKIPVLSGGTGFFLKNFIYGLPQAPPSDPAIRAELQKRAETEGTEVLRTELEKGDPVSWSRIKAADTYRIIRALEVLYTSGQPLSSFTLSSRPRKEYSFFLIGLNRDREELYDRINRRVDLMFDAGLPEEYKMLRKMGYNDSSPGLSAIGYREFSLMEKYGSFTLAEIRELIKQNSRNYAKRQLTYFRALENVRWINPGEWETIEKEILIFLEQNSHVGIK